MEISPALLTTVGDDPVAVLPDLVVLFDPDGGEAFLAEIDRVGAGLDDLSLRLLREHVLPVDTTMRRKQSEFRESAGAGAGAGASVSRQAIQQRATTLGRRLQPTLDMAARHPITRHLDQLAGDVCAVADLPAWLRPLLSTPPGHGDWGESADVAQVIARAALTGRRVIDVCNGGGCHWISTDDADLTDRMHEIADALTPDGASVVVGHDELAEWLRATAPFRIGPRSIGAVVRAMTDERVALRLDDQFVVFGPDVRTSVVGDPDGGHTRRRGTALDRAVEVRALLPRVAEADLLEALRTQYGMTANSINVLRADLRRG